MFNTNSLAKLGAFFYVLWGLLHLRAAHSIYTLASTVEPSMVQARLYQGAWNLACVALVAVVVALLLNWRNSRAGFWANLVIIGFVDLGFVLYVLVPGHLPWWPNMMGPILWGVAGVFSAWALIKSPAGVCPASFSRRSSACPSGLNVPVQP